MSYLNDVSKQLDLIERGQSVIEESKIIRAWAESLAAERKGIVADSVAARALRRQSSTNQRDVSLQTPEDDD